MLQKTKNSLKVETTILDDEVVVCVNTGGLGAFCGAFVVSKEDAQDIVSAINNSETALRAQIHN